MKRQLFPRVLLGKTQDEAFPFTLIPASCRSEEREAVVILELNPKEWGEWSDRDYVVLEVDSSLSSTLTVELRFYRGTEAIFSMKNSLLGGRRVSCCFDLWYLNSSRRYPRNLIGHLKCVTMGLPTRPDEVDRVEVLVYRGIGFKSLELRDLYLTDQLPPLALEGPCMVDEFGQAIGKEWKGKIHSQEELSDYLKEEYALSQKSKGYPTAELDRFGGYRGLSFEKTGRFYLHFDGQRHWLVDPDGNAFFSNGICYGSRMGVFGMINGMEKLFSVLPEESDPLYASAYMKAEDVAEYVKRNGKEEAAGKRLVNFSRYNMMRVFGEDWKKAWLSINVARMKSWGFNTISVCVNEYPDEDTLWFLREAKIPYCFTLKYFPRTELSLYRDFPDVFSAEYEEKCKDFACQILPFAEDEYFIGYFVTNEPEWMFQKNADPVRYCFSSPRCSDTKKYFIGLLMEKYSSLEALNAAWNTEFSSWSSLEEAVSLSEENDAVKEDCARFREILMDRLTSVPSCALRSLAPRALNLGMRFSSVEKDHFGSIRGFDVYSFNCYRAHPSSVFDLAEKALPIPYLVGEWHIGGVEGGMLGGGIVNATTQRQRGIGCAQYLRSALIHPGCLGIHYFEWNDHPLLGRFDGENKQIGWIDVCNRPYEDCVAEFSAMAKKMYSVRLGLEEAPEVPWETHYRF